MSPLGDFSVVGAVLIDIISEMEHRIDFPVGDPAVGVEISVLPIATTDDSESKTIDVPGRERFRSSGWRSTFERFETVEVMRVFLQTININFYRVVSFRRCCQRTLFIYRIEFFIC